VLCLLVELWDEAVACKLKNYILDSQASFKLLVCTVWERHVRAESGWKFYDIAIKIYTYICQSQTKRFEVDKPADKTYIYKTI
jgi:hypothetical protein